MLRVTAGARFDDACLIVALDVKKLRCAMSCRAPITHIHHDYWHKGKSLKHGCCCVAAVLLLHTECGCEAERPVLIKTIHRCC